MIASFLATCLIGRFMWKRRHAWLRREFERNDQLVALFVLILGANAALSYSYTKDVIVSPAGLFMALAVFAASSDYLADFRARKASAIPAIVLLTLLSTTWAVRAVGIHAALAETAINYREQWAYFDGHIGAWGLDANDPSAMALKQELQDDAVLRHPVHPPIREQWTRFFDTD